MRGRAPLSIVVLTLVLASCGVSRDVVDAGQAATTSTSRVASTSTTSGTTSTTSASSPSTSATTPPGSFTPAPLKWSDCARGLQCARLDVPLDYDDLSKGTVSLKLERRPANRTSERIGSLLVNPGGPGVAGTELVEQASFAYSKNLLDRFDVVGWDPRGTGDSSPIDCVDDLDPYFSLDPSPDDEAERQALIDASKQWDAACEKKSGKVLPYVSTQDSAKDMHVIREALGEDKVSYFGFSYGSELGATYATLFPGDIRAMVIDGAADPSAGYEADARQSTIGIERTLDKALDACSHDSSCPFGNGDAGAAFDRLWAKLDTDPVPVSEDGRPAVGQGVALYAVVSTLYDQASWPVLYNALASLEQGDGDRMLELYDAYLHRNPDGSWDNSFEGLIAINCIDDPGPLDTGGVDRLAQDLAEVAPRLGSALNENFQCAFWPAKQKPPLTITGKGAGPIVVVGTLGDPVTPIESTRDMAKALEHGVLVTVDANQHTGYGVNDCIVRAVDNYLISLKVPAADTAC